MYLQEGERKENKEERAKERRIPTLHKFSESQKQLSNSKQKTVLPSVLILNVTELDLLAKY